jgi:hypothetical protein
MPDPLKGGDSGIRRWHWGKLVILWAWGGTIAALFLTSFLSHPVGEAPVRSLLAFLVSLVILIGLSAVTWLWLGGKDKPSAR